MGLFLTSVATEGVARMNIDLDSIETTGDHAFGVDAYSGQSDVALVMTGSVRTSGGYADGVSVIGPGVDVTMSGSIVTTGERAEGIRATARDGDATITHDGTVMVSGVAAGGLAAISLHGDASVTSRGSVSATAISARPSRQIPMTETSALTLRQLRPAAFCAIGVLARRSAATST